MSSSERVLWLQHREPSFLVSTGVGNRTRGNNCVVLRLERETETKRGQTGLYLYRQ